MHRRGFTLIEMLVTLTLLGILASITMPFVQLHGQQAREQDLRQALREVRAAIDAYKAASDAGRIYRSATDSGYPPNLTVLVSGVPNQQSPKGEKLYFLRRIPEDPMSDHTPIEAQQWGVRSYDSPPESPREGKDVYDIYSLSPATGLNGIPYRDW